MDSIILNGHKYESLPHFFITQQDKLLISNKFNF